MRIIISPISETDTSWAVDFYRRRPFIAFERLDPQYCKTHGDVIPCGECTWGMGYDRGLREKT